MPTYYKPYINHGFALAGQVTIKGTSIHEWIEVPLKLFAQGISRDSTE